MILKLINFGLAKIPLGISLFVFVGHKNFPKCFLDLVIFSFFTNKNKHYGNKHTIKFSFACCKNHPLCLGIDVFGIWSEWFFKLYANAPYGR